MTNKELFSQVFNWTWDYMICLIVDEIDTDDYETCLKYFKKEFSSRSKHELKKLKEYGE